MGPFFRRFARELTSVGATVSKINFNGGDQLFFGGVGAVPYRGTLHAWPNWLKQFCLERRIDVIFLFGDCRAYHSHAMRIAKKTGIPVYVFEEGYLRPDFITLERGGVNGHSTMGPRPEHSGEAPEAEEVGEGGEIGRAPDEVRVGKAFWLGARCAAHRLPAPPHREPRDAASAPRRLRPRRSFSPLDVWLRSLARTHHGADLQKRKKATKHKELPRATRRGKYTSK